MRAHLKTDDTAVAGLSPLMAVALIVWAVILLFILVFLGLCLASVFLPAILVLVGLVMAWKGVGGPKPLLLVGVVLIFAGVVAWLLS